MPDTMIEVENVSKKFSRSLQRGMLYTVADVTKDLLGVWRGRDRLRPEEFWSVRDVSFSLQRGECLGLVGMNGAGKSTLLKMLNGIIRPDRGSIRMRGRVGALIEVGAGFHPMLTGRENIYINGAILGMSKREIDRKFDAIVEFSGLDSAILDAPVKSYSSGMYVRLGFAIAVHTEPDILLVDEVLAVGDIRFSGQCRRKIEELRQQGTCLLFVSHNLSLVEQICTQGLMLERGQVVSYGSVGAALNAYRARALERDTAPNRTQSAGEGRAAPALKLLTGEVFDKNGSATTTLRCGEPATLRLALRTRETVDSGVLSVWFLRADDQQTAGIGYLEVGRDLPPLESGELNLRFRCQVVPGEYRLGVTFSTDGSYGLVDEFTPCTLAVEPSLERRTPEVGVYMLDIEPSAPWARGAAARRPRLEHVAPLAVVNGRGAGA